MKTILRLIFVLAVLGAISLSARAEGTSLQGILLTASNAAGQTDRRLAPYEPTLRRILRFESYQYVGADNASVDVPATGSLALGDGHELEVTTERSDGKSVHLKVRWTAGGRTLMNTGLVLRPGVPAVLGGPSTGNKGEVYAVILIGR
ncbi:hypothetical protein Verru16b_02858 [Lacunisphaera limnophila]|uniref:Uncharacterized protein n=1 Tax=Lacunisphaera limnophila TaxID=1838286 RepID=A0A1D8AY10_9BACT|nr:hypothetical protein [Lacunisphaera limnophila]AOS45770.1 hypothetical protein Verru16b_02858 [Lacunisphaera limnophila]